LFLLALLFGLLPQTARAGDGPWVAGNGNISGFFGMESQRFNRLNTRDGQGSVDVVDVDQGVSTLGLKAIGTIGIRDRVELEFSIPWYQVRANREDGPLCSALGLSACRKTEGIGILTLRGKGTVVDELYGAPLTVAVGLETRLGQLTAPTRARITNLGEGSLDFGVFSSVGRSSQLGESGYWSGYIEGLFRYRLPNTKNYEGMTQESLAAPGFEVETRAKLLIGWNKHVGLGPAITLSTRPMGLDFGEISLEDIDRFSALKTANFRVGGQVLMRATDRITFSASAMHTVYAQNNPYATVFSVGVSFFGLLSTEKPS
jgi:hypothetical protein